MRTQIRSFYERKSIVQIIEGDVVRVSENLKVLVQKTRQILRKRSYIT